MIQHPPEITSPSIYYTAEDLRTLNNVGQTLLEQAIAKREKEKFYILLQAYEDQNIPIFAEGLNAKALIFSIIKGYTDIFKTLLGKGADIKQAFYSITPLEVSIISRKKEISDILLKEYEDRKIPIFTEGKNIKALNYSIEGGYIDIVRRLLGHQGVDIRVISMRRRTALKLALDYDDKKEIADLLATFHAISDVELREEEVGDYYRSKGTQEASVREYLTKLNLISRFFREAGLSIKQILDLEITAKDIEMADSTTTATDSYVWPDPLSLEAIKSDVRTRAEPRSEVRTEAEFRIEITKLAENLYRLKNNGTGLGFFNLVNSKLPDDKKIENLREIDSAIEFLSKAKLIPEAPEAISSLTITNTSKDQLQLISLASIVADFIANPERYVEKSDSSLTGAEESKEPDAEPPIAKKDETFLAIAEEIKKQLQNLRLEKLLNCALQ